VTVEFVHQQTLKFSVPTKDNVT